MRRRQENPEAAELVLEAEAFLAGTYVDHMVEAGRRVPTWAWINLLAHGNEAEVRETARGSMGVWSLMRTMFTGPTQRDAWPNASVPDWCRARAFLAGEVLDEIRARGCTIQDLQEEILIPLELALATHRPARRWAPAELVGSVLAALAEHSPRNRPI
ncbi:MAG TPA: hypothetical protein VFJ85_02165 [Acidimicrobiales bacterium]|nr:hypothetical protein [Acidimicrobiales bacterium]